MFEGMCLTRVMEPFLVSFIYPKTHINANPLVLQFQASSAYWRGDKDRESLQRVYGISYPDQKSLKVISTQMLFLY